ncbi:MAG: PDZ domain-containing protein [Deltaproteobacteria bacterium]|nr:MAG: PDZ domain-containing protein [Deltaproteobacteria bacterium]
MGEPVSTRICCTCAPPGAKARCGARHRVELDPALADEEQRAAEDLAGSRRWTGRVSRSRSPSSEIGAVPELTGIGAVLRPRGDVLRIQQVVPNGGAADAGLGPGDAIVAIDGTRVTELGFDRATGAIRGLEGTTVTLRIRRGDRELDIVVVRKLVRI